VYHHESPFVRGRRESRSREKMSAFEWTLDLEARSHPRCLRLEEDFSMHNGDRYCSIFTVLKADIELLGHMRRRAV